MAKSCRAFADGSGNEGFTQEFDRALKDGIREMKGCAGDSAALISAYDKLHDSLVSIADKWLPPGAVVEEMMETARCELEPFGISKDNQDNRKTCISIMKATGGFGSTVRLDDILPDTVARLEHAGLERSEARGLVRKMDRLGTDDIGVVIKDMDRDLKHADFFRFLAKNGATPELRKLGSDAVDEILSTKSRALPVRKEGQVVLLRPVGRCWLL